MRFWRTDNSSIMQILMGSSFEPIGVPQEKFRGHLIRISTQRMKLRSGKELVFEMAERPPGVRILVTDGTRILLTKEWRSESNDWDYRLPGGKVFDSVDEYLQGTSTGNIDDFARDTAKKELKEETSLDLSLDSFGQIHRSICGATIVWDLYYFLVKLPKEQVRELDAITTLEGEQTHPQWFSFDDVRKLCIDGHVREDRTVGVLFRYLESM